MYKDPIDIDLDLGEEAPAAAASSTQATNSTSNKLQNPQHTTSAPAKAKKPMDKKKLRTILLSTLIPVAAIGGGVGTFFAVKSCKSSSSNDGNTDATAVADKVTVIKSNVQQGKESTFELEFKEQGKYIDSMTITVGNATYTLPDLSVATIDGGKVTIKADKMAGDKVIITAVELKNTQGTAAEFETLYNKFYTNYTKSTTKYESVTFGSGSKVKGKTTSKGTIAYQDIGGGVIIALATLDDESSSNMGLGGIPWSMLYEAALKDITAENYNITYTLATNKVSYKAVSKTDQTLYLSFSYGDTTYMSDLDCTFNNSSYFANTKLSGITYKEVAAKTASIEYDTTFSTAGITVNAETSTKSIDSGSTPNTITIKYTNSSGSDIKGTCIVKCNDTEVKTTSELTFTTAGADQTIQITSDDWAKITGDSPKLKIYFNKSESVSATVSGDTSTFINGWTAPDIASPIKKGTQVTFTWTKGTKNVAGHFEVINTDKSNIVVAQTTAKEYSDTESIATTNLDWTKIENGNKLVVKFVVAKGATLAQGTFSSEWTVDGLHKAGDPYYKGIDEKVYFRYKSLVDALDTQGHFEIVNTNKSNKVVASTDTAKYIALDSQAGVSVSTSNLDWENIDDNDALVLNFVEEKEATVTTGTMPSTDWTLPDLPAKINNKSTTLGFTFTPAGTATADVKGHFEVVTDAGTVAGSTTTEATYDHTKTTAISITNLDWHKIAADDKLVVKFVEYKEATVKVATATGLPTGWTIDETTLTETVDNLKNKNIKFTLSTTTTGESIKGHFEVINTTTSEKVEKWSKASTFEAGATEVELEWLKINDGNTLEFSFVEETSANISVLESSVPQKWSLSITSGTKIYKGDTLNFTFGSPDGQQTMGSFEVINTTKGNISVGTLASATYNPDTVYNLSITELDWTQIDKDDTLQLKFVI